MHYQARKPGTAGLKLSSVDNAARQSQTNDRDNDVLCWLNPISPESHPMPAESTIRNPFPHSCVPGKKQERVPCRIPGIRSAPLEPTLPSDSLDRPLDPDQTLHRPLRRCPLSSQLLPILIPPNPILRLDQAVKLCVLVRVDRFAPFGAYQVGVDHDIDLLGVEP